MCSDYKKHYSETIWSNKCFISNIIIIGDYCYITTTTTIIILYISVSGSSSIDSKFNKIHICVCTEWVSKKIDKAWVDMDKN